LVSSVTVFSLAEWTERKKRDRERKIGQATDAFIGLQKLMSSLNLVENIARHIDREFRSAETDGMGVVEPAAIVRPIVGADREIEQLHAKEFAFLIDESGTLASLVSEIQDRCMNTLAAIKTFNDLKADYDRFSEEHAEVKEVVGETASMHFDGRNSMIAQLKVGRMNLLLNDIISSLEEDRNQVKEVTEAFIAKAVEVFGDDFPAKKLEMRTNG